MFDHRLQSELAQHLTPLRAPAELGVRLGFAPVKHRRFPRLAVALAAAVVMMMAGGLAANRKAGGDLGRVAAQESRNAETVAFTSSDPGAVSVWLGHAPAVVTPAWTTPAWTTGGVRRDADHTPVLMACAGTGDGSGARKGKRNPRVSAEAVSFDAGCGLCHSL